MAFCHIQSIVQNTFILYKTLHYPTSDLTSYRCLPHSLCCMSQIDFLVVHRQSKLIGEFDFSASSDGTFISSSLVWLITSPHLSPYLNVTFSTEISLPSYLNQQVVVYVGSKWVKLGAEIKTFSVCEEILPGWNVRWYLSREQTDKEGLAVWRYFTDTVRTEDRLQNRPLP